MGCVIQDKTTSRWISFLVSCIVSITASSVMAFSVYENDIKAIFNLTQTEVEFLGAFGNVFAAFGLPAGYVYEQCGLMTSLISALFLGLGGCILIFSATLTPAFYHVQSWLLIVYACIYGWSTTIMYLIPITINVKNFSSHYRGTVIGALGACYWGGPSVFAALYGAAFAKDADVGTYFLTLTFIFVVVNVLAILFMKELPQDIELKPVTDRTRLVQEKPTIKTPINTNTTTKTPENTQTDSKETDHKDPIIETSISSAYDVTGITGRELLKDPDFHLLFWSFLLPTAVQLAIVMNSGIYLQSFGKERYLISLTVVGPIIGGLFALFSGLISDRLVSKGIPRAIFLCVGAALQTVLFAFLTVFGDDMALYVTTLFSFYVLNSAFFVVVPAIFSDSFGMKHFSTNFGTAVLVFALVALATMAVFGVVYDSHVDTSISITCYGLHCFRDTLILGTCLSLVSFVLLVILTIRTWKHISTE